MVVYRATAESSVADEAELAQGRAAFVAAAQAIAVHAGTDAFGFPTFGGRDDKAIEHGARGDRAGRRGAVHQDQAIGIGAPEVVVVVGDVVAVVVDVVVVDVAGQ